MFRKGLAIIGLSLGVCMMAQAKTVVTITSTANPQKVLGQIAFTDTLDGLLIEPNLHGLSPGSHGFHIHVKPFCSDMGRDAGPHFDPKKTGKHLGPYTTMGHLGDLPLLYADQKGLANTPVFAPRLQEVDLRTHAIIIHAHGDNYSDHPKKLGGGGARIACGVIPMRTVG